MTLEEFLHEQHQEHVLRFYDELSGRQKELLAQSLRTLDWSLAELRRHPEDLSGRGEIAPIGEMGLREIQSHRNMFFTLGRDAISAGKVGAVLLAGGQGTRLGISAPKGMYPIGPWMGKSIFELHIANLLLVAKVCGKAVPLYIMTSEKNDAETKNFFRTHNYFGYPKEEIFFFTQEMAPCFDFEGKLLLEEKGKLATSPDGNGGWYGSLMRCGLADSIERRGIEWLNVVSVDNVLQRIADPVFVGATIASGVNCGAKVVRKTSPDEKVGVLCLENGLPSVIEYYELSEEMANARNDRGELLYSCGVILNYLFRTDRLRAVSMRKLPVHLVKKKVPYLNEEGVLVTPEEPNAYKCETLILDMVKLMGDCLPFEVVREQEFAPVKNRTGIDSVDTARELLLLNGVYA